MRKIDLNYFPGWVRKSVSFTIDDGNIRMDTKFLELTKPYGIKGTFNLCSDRLTESADFYREFYEGYEIANHCKAHPFCISDTADYKYTEDSFDAEGADRGMVYRSETEGYFMVYDDRRKMWLKYATPEKYVELIKQGQAELDEMFGKGAVRSYVWPFGEQNSAFVKEYLSKTDYYGVRKTGCVLDSEGFDMPKCRLEWSYTANHANLLEIMEKYEAYPDDGGLKFFCFGVHSVDFERAENWCDLESFSKTYGNRPEDYYYASVGEIFDYENAVKGAVVIENSVTNGSPLTLYITVDGEKATVPPNSVYNF